MGLNFSENKKKKKLNYTMNKNVLIVRVAKINTHYLKQSIHIKHKFYEKDQ